MCFLIRISLQINGFVSWLPKRIFVHYPLKQIATKHCIQPASDRRILTALEPGGINPGELTDERKNCHIGEAPLAVTQIRVKDQQFIQFFQKNLRSTGFSALPETFAAKHGI